jgi:hypothetical protein
VPDIAAGRAQQVRHATSPMQALMLLALDAVSGAGSDLFFDGQIFHTLLIVTQPQELMRVCRNAVNSSPDDAGWGIPFADHLRELVGPF